MTNALHQIKNQSDFHNMWDTYKILLDEAILDSVPREIYMSEMKINHLGLTNKK